jgi:hypothetical protein
VGFVLNFEILQKEARYRLGRSRDRINALREFNDQQMIPE